MSGEPDDYEYLKHSKTSVEGVDDHAEWRGLEVSVFDKKNSEIYSDVLGPAVTACPGRCRFLYL